MPADRPPGFHTLADLESFAGSRVPPEIWDYIQGGAGEERTLRANRRTFEARTLFPRVLSGVRSVDPTTTILGHRVSAPFFASPTAYQGAIHPDGESGTARACQSAGILGIYSTLASHSIGQVAAAAPKGMRWFQLYLQPDPRVTDRLLTDAERAGCTALVVTVDTPLLGLRDRQSRLGFALRAPVPVGNGPDVLSPAREPTREGERFTVRTEAAATWKVIDELAHATRLPLVVKGILTPSDARRAVAHGARGILVSNHGGRQLDGAPASLDALP
ncbi:MAG TPA: alpha-hydroxy acid oxidase, partial [Thermoplasmata archaeon]|nr:alpha-hydroxy acid oxidase [Thermoplasmata archaeon]